MQPISSEEVKEFCRNRDIDFVGVAPVERFAHAPEGRHPTDLLPEARSVIVIGLRVLVAVGRAAKLAYTNPRMRHAAYVHMMFGYKNLNEPMDWTNHKLARMLERKGYCSLPIPASPPDDSYTLFGAFSHRHAAVAAGLGELGWNGLLIAPQVGPRLRLASLITEAELQPDPMYDGKPLCNPKRCSVCVCKCPTGAFSKTETVRAVIGERECEYAKLKKRRCTLNLNALEADSPGISAKFPDDPSAEEWFEILKEYGSPWQAIDQSAIGRGSPGCRCVYECPVGSH